MNISRDLVLKEERIQRLNLACCTVQLITGGAMAILVAADDGTLPLYVFYADTEVRTQVEVELLKSEVKVGYLSVAFLFMSACYHALVATVLRGRYEACLRRYQNPFRWIEYSLSASTMHVMIAALSGVYAIHLLVAVFGLTATTMVFGHLQERSTHLSRNTSGDIPMESFWAGFVPHTFVWVIISSYFFHAVAHGDPPNFVWSIFFILLVLDESFAVVMWLQQKKIGWFKDYLNGEISFCILSLVSKQLLAWINFGGSTSL